MQGDRRRIVRVTARAQVLARRGPGAKKASAITAAACARSARMTHNHPVEARRTDAVGT